LKKPIIYAVIAAAMSLAAPGAIASEAAAREICKQFITRSGYSVKDWGEYWNWTTINNRDGTWSVGARVNGLPPGGGLTNMYLTCTAKQSGDQWMLEKITRIQ
jgi:hypothetical protein